LTFSEVKRQLEIGFNGWVSLVTLLILLTSYDLDDGLKTKLNLNLGRKTSEKAFLTTD
jgi:hypothetical protein